MSAYTIALFVHIVGAMLLFVVLALEGVALRQMRRAVTAADARTAASLLRLNRIVGPISLVGLLGAGVYLTATAWGWVAWILVALGAYGVIAVLGAVNGIRIVGLERTLSNESASLAQPTSDRLRDPMFLASWFGRVGIAFAVLFLMTAKPGLVEAALSVAIGAAAGLALSAPLWRRSRQPDRQKQSS